MMAGFLVSRWHGVQSSGNAAENRDLISRLSACESHPHESLTFESSTRYHCYEQTIGGIGRRYGVHASVGALKAYMETPAGNLLQGARCHAIGHTIGETAVARHDSSQEILTTCKDFCGFGCLNGAAHAWILLNGNVMAAETFCKSAEVSEDVKNGCFHGIGHGVAEYANLNIEKGLALCDQLKDKDAQFQCGHAVIMDVRHVSLPASGTLPSDIVHFCVGLSDTYRPSCDIFAGFLEYGLTHNASSAFSVCARVPSAVSRDCNERIGEALLMASIKDTTKIFRGCNAATDTNALRSCLFGSLRASIDGPDSFAGEAAFRLCASVSKDVRNQCFTYAGGLLVQRYGSIQRAQACAILPSAERMACLSHE